MKEGRFLRVYLVDDEPLALKRIRIHRATLLNVNYIEETTSWFGGGMVVRLKDGKHTEQQIARARVRELRSLLDF